MKMRVTSPYSVLFRLAALRISHIFWVSKSALEQYRYRKAVAEKSVVLYNVIDRGELFKRMQMDPHAYNYAVVFVGRMSSQKNPGRLIRVLENVVRKAPALKAAIVGTGPLFEQIQGQVRDRGLENQIHLLGYMDNPLKLLYDAKVMIMTSDCEGTPMVVLEAMALGVPIVSTPTDGICELVLEGETGFLSDDDSVLANRLIALACDEEVRHALSNRSLERFSELVDLNKYRFALESAYRG